MQIPRYIIKAVQHACHMRDADIDGIFGPRTLAGAREYDIECDDFDIPVGRSRELLVTVAQHASGLRGSDLDGLLGPRTKASVLAYLKANNIDSAAPTRRPKKSAWAVWQPHDNPRVYVKDGIDLRDGTVLTPPGGLDAIPTRKTRDSVYGNALKLGQKGMEKRLATITGLPGRFNKGTGTLPLVHHKVVPHVKMAFELWEKFGVLDEIYKIWFFNYRHMRHDPRRPLSLHSWGIACDVNAKENFAWTPKRNERKIQPFSTEWYRKYPRGLSDVAVLCMKKVGFGWGGDWPTFRDPMHFQLMV